MIEKLALSLANKIKQSDSVAVSVEVMAYEIGRQLNNYIIILLTLLISFIQGDVLYSLVVMLSFVCIRKFSGGHHMNNYLSCIVASVSIFVIVPNIKLSDIEISVLFAISLVIFSVFSPNFYNKDHSLLWKKRAKIISLLLLITAFILHSSTMTIVFFVQSILILPWKGGVK